MPNRAFHVATSTPAGAGYSFCKANKQSDLTRTMETFGGALGATWAGYCPTASIRPYILATGRSAMASFPWLRQRVSGIKALMDAEPVAAASR